MEVKEQPRVCLLSSSSMWVPRDLTQVVRLGKCISLQMQPMSTSDNCRGWIEGQGEVSKTGKCRCYPQMISCSDQDSRIRETGG